jgi:hypothetical protein
MTYDIVQVMRYVILKDGSQASSQEFTTRKEAEAGVRSLVARDEAEAAKQERNRKARSKAGKWTPSSLREYLARDPHWEITDKSDGGRDGNFRGVWQATWRSLDESQPFITRTRRDGSTFEEPNFDIYGDCYIVTINDDDNSSRGAQFALRDTRIQSGLAREYATVDRLAAALIWRGIMD